MLYESYKERVMDNRTETLEVSKHQEAILKALAQEKGVSIEDYLESVILEITSEDRA